MPVNILACFYLTLLTQLLGWDYFLSQQKKKLTSYIVPFFPNLDWQGKRLIIDPFSPRGSYFLTVSLCILRG